MYGWTMLCKWGHPVATLPVTNETICHIRKMTEILRINVQFLYATLIEQGYSLTPQGRVVVYSY
eukprot:6214645-Pleurochrysis_carterae.AAC.2